MLVDSNDKKQQKTVKNSKKQQKLAVCAEKIDLLFDT